MKLKLEDIDVSVREKVGVALYIAQRLEYSMVCHLIVRKKLHEKIVTDEMIDLIESQIGNKPLGWLIRTLDAEVENDPSSDNALDRALSYRNYLAHGFYKNYGKIDNPTRRTAVMLNHLELIIIEMKSAIDLMQHWTDALAFSHKIDIEIIQQDYDRRISILNGG